MKLPATKEAKSPHLNEISSSLVDDDSQGPRRLTNPGSADQAAQLSQQLDWIANEVACALVINGISHAVMMATPRDLEDFALGFGLTEGILNNPKELYGVEVTDHEAGIEIQMTVSSACEWRLKDRRRNLVGRTGCGVCGVDSLQQLRQSLHSVHSLNVLAKSLSQAQSHMRALQEIQLLTGATHAAAWCSLQGDIVLMREDIGRHNALDKLIGAMQRSQQNTQDGFICITSRASFEMVQKTIVAGAGLLCAASAPSALAVDIAIQHNLVLVGFARAHSLVAYTYANRIN